MTEYETIEEARSAEKPWLDGSFLRELYVEKRLSSVRDIFIMDGTYN